MPANVGCLEILEVDDVQGADARARKQLSDRTAEGAAADQQNSHRATRVEHGELVVARQGPVAVDACDHSKLSGKARTTPPEER